MALDQDRLNQEADYFANVAATRADAAAEDGERTAADPNQSEHTRLCAARTAHICRADAAEYRNMAAALRAGEIPDGLNLD